MSDKEEGSIESGGEGRGGNGYEGEEKDEGHE